MKRKISTHNLSFSTNGGKCIQYRSVGTTRIPAKWVAAFNAANAELEKAQTEATPQKD